MDLTLEGILKLDRTKKFLILGAVLLVITGLYCWLLLMPLEGRISQLKAKVDTLQKEKLKQEAVERELVNFRAACDDLEARLKLALEQLPDKKEIPSLLASISNLGRESGLQLASFKPESERMMDFYAEVPVDLKVSGNFKNLLTFFYKVSGLPRIVNFSSLSLKGPAKQEDREVFLDVSCKATTYRFLDETERLQQEAAKKEKKGRKKKKKRR